MGSRPVIRKETKIWFLLICVIAIDFVLTFFGVTTGKAQELNPFTKELWAAQQWMPLFLFTFISNPFMIYGQWTFFDRNNKLLYFNIAYYSIVIANNLRVALL